MHAELTLELGLSVKSKRGRLAHAQAGIQDSTGRRRHGCTIGDPSATPTLELVEQDFTVTKPNRFVGYRYHRTPRLRRHPVLCSVIDAGSRLIVGWVDCCA